MSAALDFVNRSIDSDALNIRAQNLKAAVLRALGHPKEALQVLASASHKADPLDVRTMAERWLASKSPADAKAMSAAMNEFPATAQETAAEYFNAGLWQDGRDVLLQAVAAAPDKSKINAMVYYYLGYFADKLKQSGQAAEYYKLAASMPPDYVFPFQNEAIDVLRAAMKANARDARAPYYLGNLLYDWQPEEAARMWEASASIDPAFSIVHRNLATAYMHQRSGANLEKTIAELEKAVSLQPKLALHFTELDELYEQTGTPIEKRLSLFEANAAMVAQRDDTQNRAVTLKMAAGKYDEAIRMMTGRTFAVAEGANLNVGEQWTNAHLLRGRQHIAAKRYKEAIADFETAVNIPSTMPSSFRRGAGAQSAEFAYWTGVAYAGLGDNAKAVESWKKGSAALSSLGSTAESAAGGGPPVTWGSSAVGAGRGFGNTAGMGAQYYFQALCYQKLGQDDKARQLLNSLLESGQRGLKQLAEPRAADGPGRRFGRPQSPRLREADAHFTIGLAYLGLNNLTEAKAEFTQAVKTSPELLGARVALASLN